jgi:hypothetical protein
LVVDRRGGFGRWGGCRNKGQKKEDENGNGGGERWLAAEKRGQWRTAATGRW